MDEFDEEMLDALRDGNPTASTNYRAKSPSPTTRSGST